MFLDTLSQDKTVSLVKDPAKFAVDHHRLIAPLASPELTFIKATQHVSLAVPVDIATQTEYIVSNATVLAALAVAL